MFHFNSTQFKSQNPSLWMRLRPQQTEPSITRANINKSISLDAMSLNGKINIFHLKFGRRNKRQRHFFEAGRDKGHANGGNAQSKTAEQSGNLGTRWQVAFLTKFNKSHRV